MNKTHLTLTLAAIGVFAVLAIHFSTPIALLFFVAFCTIINRPSARLCVTLSVPEILADTMAAFRTPLLPLPMFSTDFSQDTAVKGDVIYGHISQLPSIQSYDLTGGFKTNAANVTSLIVDVPCTMNSLYHSPVKISWLDQLSARKALYKEAQRNLGFPTAKKICDDAFALLTTANFSNKFVSGDPFVFSLDTLESIRTQCNLQKIAPEGRYGIVNTTIANAMESDDRIKSNLFYGQLNGKNPYRRWTNVAGFEVIYEYPALPTTGGLTGFWADARAITLAMRLITFSNAAEMLGVPEIIKFIPMIEPQTGMVACGVMWQEPGTGDVYVSCAVLYGVSAGSQGGAPGAICDNAGLLMTSA